MCICFNFVLFIDLLLTYYYIEYGKCGCKCWSSRLLTVFGNLVSEFLIFLNHGNGNSVVFSPGSQLVAGWPLSWNLSSLCWLFRKLDVWGVQLFLLENPKHSICHFHIQFFFLKSSATFENSKRPGRCSEIEIRVTESIRIYRNCVIQSQSDHRFWFSPG